MSWCEWLDIAEDERKEHLLSTLVSCNQQAAKVNQNASSAALIGVAVCGGTFESAICAALLTLGDKHGPLMAARRVIYQTPHLEIEEALEDGEILAGWGNSFFKLQIDPAFVPIDRLVRADYPEASKHLDRISEAIFKITGHVILPNAAAYGAICAQEIGMVPGIEILLFVASRLPAWSRQYMGARS